MREKEKLVEAALFMAPQPLDVRQLMQVMGESDYSAAKAAVLGFVKEFNARDSSLEIVQSDGSFQMRVRQGYAARVQHLASEALFNKGTMKTLALVAFKQPISQSLVVKYRNNKAYDHLKALVEEGFVARAPKGRTYLLRTTKKFLEYFGSPEEFRQGK